MRQAARARRAGVMAKKDSGCAVLGSACAVIAAGGVGSRLGHTGGKQLMEVAGRPLMSWSLTAFDQAQSIGHIVVVCPADRMDEMRAAAVEPLGLATPVSYARAGATRQDSTRAGVAAVPAGFDVVAIHDGARPLVTPEVIDRAVGALYGDGADEGADATGGAVIAGELYAWDGVVCGQPAVDTLKEVGPAGTIAATPDRTRFWTVQTPQVFPVAVMRVAYDAAERAGFTGTDDASLVERAGGHVLLLKTPRDNLKATVPEDLPLIEALLRMRSG